MNLEQQQGQIVSLLEDLISVLRDQAHDFDKIATRLSQVTTHMPEVKEMGVAVSELTELALRAKRLRESMPMGED